MTLSKTTPPIIPFMPLILKDMTFTHEGNKTYTDGLVNFEKMHMLAQTIRTMRMCRSRPLSNLKIYKFFTFFLICKACYHYYFHS